MNLDNRKGQDKNGTVQLLQPWGAASQISGMVY